MSEPSRLPLVSQDVIGKRLQALLELFPEARGENGLDINKLQQTLGGAAEGGKERYGLSWAGKSEAIRNLRTLSAGTLKPRPDQSVNFETSENLIIEGDNLEVLKLLQKSYHSKVKMIYIDPPYNTGNEFIYPDNFHEGLQDYLRYTGQKDANGNLQTTNKETNGRYHSNWLSMMYPRLFLARNLLREDGVIFVSIDDHEVHNLRLAMDEVFGEENFIANVIWQKKFAPQNDARYFSDNHDHILVYAKLKDNWQRNLLPTSSLVQSRYSNLDNDIRGDWSSGDLTVKTYSATNDYPITTPSGRIVKPPDSRCWAFSQRRMAELINDNRIWFGASGNNVPRLKQFRTEIQDGMVPITIWLNQVVGHNQEAKQEFKKLMFSGSDEDEEQSVNFDSPKPTRLIKHILRIASLPQNNDIILDFFAGSGTTAQAVLELNHEDGGNRRFLLVQLPERIDNPGYPTIAHITRERVRRVIQRMDSAANGKLDLGGDAPPDRGFKAFELAESQFKSWDGAAASQATPEQLEERVLDMADNLNPNAADLDILFEIILKAGRSLSALRTPLNVNGQTAYAIGDGSLIVCLERDVSRETLQAIIALKPAAVLCLDAAFRGRDSLLTNAALEMERANITFQTA